MNKMNVRKWFNSPALWAHFTVFVLIICFLINDVAYCASDSVVYANETVAEFFGIETSVIFTRDKINEQVSDSSVLTYNTIPSTGFSISMNYFTGNNVNNPFELFQQYNNTLIDYETCYHLFTGNISGNSLSYTKSYMCVGSSVIYIVPAEGNYYLCSTSPFICYLSSKSDSAYIPTSYATYTANDNTNKVTVNGNDYYRIRMDSSPCFVTDMPMCIASSDGSTGFTSIENFDCTLASTYKDFNYLINDGYIRNPHYVAPPEPEYEVKPEGQYFNYTGLDVKYLNIDGFYGVYGDFTFNPNQYMLLHPEDYTLCIDMSMETSEGTFILNEEIPFTSVMANNDTKYHRNFPYDEFMKDGSSLGSYFRNKWSSASGASESYFSYSNIFTSGAQTVGQGSRSFSGFTVGLREIMESLITKLTLHADVYVRFNGETITYSGHRTDYYNFITGESKTLANDISYNYVEPPAGDLTNYNPYIPSTGGGASGALNSAVATIQSGAVQIYQQGGFQMPQQDWNEFGNLLGEMKNDLTTVSSDNGVLSVMQCVQNVTSGILPTSGNGTPNKLWFLIYAGVAGSIAIALWNKAAHNH